jgi:putative membrane protein insertion efficiency factor
MTKKTLKFIIKLINFYQNSPKKPHCNFVPSCSEYTKDALVKYGLFKGLFLGFKRILKCHPFRGLTIDVLK